MSDSRVETDSLGNVEVAKDKLWGVIDQPRRCPCVMLQRDAELALS